MEIESDIDQTRQIGTLAREICVFRSSDEFRLHPLKVRITYLTVAQWLLDRRPHHILADVNGSFVRRARDKGARERGWRFGNCALAFLKALNAGAVSAGGLTANRVRQVPK